MRILSRMRSEHLILVGSLAAVFAVTVLMARRPRTLGYDPQEKKQGSTHFSSPLGAKAFFTLLERVGSHPLRHERILALLPREANALWVLAPDHPWEPREVEWLREWVLRGGRLVYCPPRAAPARFSDPVLAAFHLELDSSGASGESRMEASLGPLDSREGRPYTLAVRSGLRLKPAPHETPGTPLARDAEGWGIALVPAGEGRLVALADPDLFGNAGISRAQNVEFAVRLAQLLAGGGPTVFDEFHHGFAEGQSAFSIVWDSPLAPALVLILVGCFCGVFAAGRRLGPAVELHPERRRRPAEFIESFAGLCRRMRSGPQALSMVVAEFRLHVQHTYGASTPEALEGLSRRSGLAPGAAAGALERFARLSKAASLDEETLVSSCRELESLREAFRKPPLTRTPS